MLLKKMLRDMKINLSQFISIFLMAILGVLVYSGINAEWYGMKSEVDRYYEETHVADIWVMSDHFDKSDVDRVKKLSGISEASLRLAFDAPVNSASDKTLRINIIEDNMLSTPRLIEGKEFSAEEDGLWLDESFAKANKLKIGDKIAFEINGMKLEKEILGLIMHPEYIHNVKDDTSAMPSPETFGFAFIYASALPGKPLLPYNQLLIAKNPTGDEKTISSHLEDMFSDRYTMIMNRDTHPSVATFQAEIEQNKAMGGVFPIVFFLIAALTMLTTMTRMTSNQRTQIGTLKALGFSKRDIQLHYVSYGLWIGLCGGILGLLIGPLVIPPMLFTMQKSLYTLPDWKAVISPSSFVVAFLAALCCGASSYLACRKQLKEVPAQALRPAAPKVGKHSSLEKSKLWHRFGFSVQWNFRDVMRSRVRSSMAVIGVMGCTALLIFGLGLRDTINGVTKTLYRDLNVYENKLNLKEDASVEALAELSKKFNGQYIQESNIELKSGDRKESGSLTVLYKGEEIKFQDKKNESISIPAKGIGLSNKMAELLKLKKGDTIEWRIYGEKQWNQSKVAVIYSTPMGQGIAMQKAEYEKLSRTFKPTAFLTSDKAVSENTVEGENLATVKSLQHKEQLVKTYDDMLESMRMIIAILVAAAVVLGSVVLYNLGALSFTERLRELATLRVLGFFPKQIRSLLQLQNIWLTIIGIVLGIPVGYALMNYLLSTMSDNMDMTANISLTSLFISISGTFIVSVVINLLLSLKVKKIDMITSLKSVE